MAGRFSVYSAAQIINKVCRGIDWSPPTSYWLGLFRAVNDSALRANTPASASEVLSAGAYTRIEIRGATGLIFGAPVDGVSTMGSEIAWPEATASWGVITYAAMLDSATLNAGNVIAYGPLPVSKAVDIGDVFSVPLGMFSIGL